MADITDDLDKSSKHLLSSAGVLYDFSIFYIHRKNIYYGINTINLLFLFIVSFQIIFRNRTNCPKVKVKINLYYFFKRSDKNMCNNKTDNEKKQKCR